MKNNKQPTWTKLVMGVLEGRDDFMTARQLCDELGASCNQMSATLVHLRKSRAIDCIVEPDGKAWWFVTPASDNRTRTVDERCPEEPGSRKRQHKTKLCITGKPFMTFKIRRI